MKIYLSKSVHFLIIIPLIMLLLVIFPVKTSAQNPIPLNTSIECGSYTLEDEEYHSLRPYQANTKCTSTLSDYANYCGNDLTLKDKITVNYPGSENYLYSSNSQSSCVSVGDNIRCNYKVPISEAVTINLDDAELPILGNTGDKKEVYNSANQIDSGDLKGKNASELMNEYVSWYLNGVPFKAENPPLTLTDVSDKAIVNFTGPLNKLLPQDIQFYQRSNSVKKVIEDKSHDQIVGCSLSLETPSVLGIVGEIFDIGKIQTIDIPFPCYVDLGWLGNFAKDAFIKKHRLSDWNENNNLPPIISNYSSYGEFLKAYKEWRGNKCALITVPGVIPFVGGQNLLVCVDDIFRSKFNSYLYQYIPMSSTEDVEGEIRIDNVSSSINSRTNGSIVKNLTFSNQTPSTLFFSHMEETSQLGSLLQDTYAPKGLEKVGDPTNIEEETSCNAVQVRSNAGDNLFATSLTGTMSYTAYFSCTYQEAIIRDESPNCAKKTNNKGNCVKGPWSCKDTYGELRCGDGFVCGVDCTQIVQTCNKNIDIKLSTSSKIPEVDNIWSRLVAGPMAIFKRIFPKTNTEGSVGKIIDLAGSTNITYSGTNVENTTTDLKFPHIGGVYEYFLKGIQTALRPKGYGDTINFDLNDNVNSSASSGIDCDLTAADVSSLAPNLISKENLHQLAIDYEGVEGDHVLECYNDVVRKSIDAGINPAFTLMLWINESGGSNYNISKQDFGINSSAFVGFTAQINQFLTRPLYYKQDSRWSSCFGNGKDDEMFFSIYYYGQCDPNVVPPNAQGYIDLVNTYWSSYTNCNYPGFPFEDTCH